MQDEEIIRFIKTLDKQIPKEGAEAIFRAYGEVALYANKQGYLRMAIELMKLAFDETADDHPDLYYLFDGPDCEFAIDTLCRTREDLDFFSS